MQSNQIREIIHSKIKMLGVIKKLKRIGGFIGNLLWFPVFAPLYVKTEKYQSLPILMLLVSGFVCFSIVLFLLGEFFSFLGGEATGWSKELQENPLSVFDKKFGWAVIILCLYYMWAIWRDRWDIEEIKEHFRS